MIHNLKNIKSIIGYLTKLSKEHGRAAVVNGVVLSILLIVVLTILDMRITDIVHKQITRYKANNEIEHRENFAKSREFYAELKTYMRQQCNIIGCDYMMLLEYHNGSENVVTNVQFCKFDITLNVQNSNCPYIEVGDYINENIYKYDLLLSNMYTSNKINILSTVELERIDRHFLRLITDHNDNISYVVIANIEYNRSPIGMLILLFTEDIDNVNIVAITNCALNIEREIQKGI